MSSNTFHQWKHVVFAIDCPSSIVCSK